MEGLAIPAGELVVPEMVDLVRAEEDSRRRLGRGLTVEELGRLLRWYPGDVPERREP
jgi:hypothetical protein